MIKLEISENNGMGFTKTMHDLTSTTFSGGEEHVNFHSYKNITSVLIHAQIDSSSEFMRLAMIKDILDKYNCPVYLKLLYVPYARQDRACAQGDAFSLRVFTRMLNALKFDKVHIADPHSDVTPALIDNLTVKSMMNIVSESPVLTELALRSTAVSPDSGANKKHVDLANFTGKEFIRADKVRNCANGQILRTDVYCDDLLGQEVTIWDDICDGGRTFIELAKALKAKGAGKINLYVTHGIFSKGTKPLLDSGIDHIYTTNSLNSYTPANYDDLTIINI